MVKHKLINRFGKPNALFTVFLVVALGFIGGYSLHTASASTKTGPAGQRGSIVTPNLSLSPAAQTITQGSTLTLEVWADSSTTLMNAVQANISYPANLLTYVNIDDSGSAFGVAAQGVGGNGTVRIARGSITPITGKQLVVKVNFKAATGLTTRKSTAAVNFGSGCRLLSSSTNMDILKATYGGSYTITK